MHEWAGLRTAGIIAVWLTVGGGLIMALIWVARGGARAVGPEDEFTTTPADAIEVRQRKVTSFSSAQVGIHAFLALLAASFISYGLGREDDRSTGYVALVVALLVTAIPGVFMFRKWRAGQRPDVPGADAASERVEDHLPRLVVYLHGLAAVTTLGLVIALIVVD